MDTTSDTTAVEWTFTEEDVVKDMLTVGYDLTKNQRDAVRNLLSGMDVIAIMPTGSGKSLIFQALTHTSVIRGINAVTLIVTPLKSISYTHRKSFARFQINCLDMSTNSESDFASMSYNAVVTQPEMIISPKGQQVMRILGKRCLLFVVDEAHCIKRWGDSSKKGSKPFRKHFKELANVLSKLENRPLILCLTATMTELSETSTMRYLGLDPGETFYITCNPANPRICLINSVGKLKIDPIVDLLRKKQCPRIIIFENSLVDCGYRYLEFKKALECEPELVQCIEVFHSQIPEKKQEEVASNLMEEHGYMRVVIATSALSMGFDAVGVEYIIHTKMTRTLEDFIQMSGRAGRKDGLKAYCILFTESKTRDMEKVCDFYRTQNASCRRAVIAQYFKGEVVPHSNPENDTCCDICCNTADSLTEQLCNKIQSKTASMDVDEFPQRRKVRTDDREYFRKALQCQLISYNKDMPFMDCELTEGVISVLTKECSKMFNKGHIERLIPGLSDTVKHDIMYIIQDIFLDV